METKHDTSYLQREWEKDNDTSAFVQLTPLTGFYKFSYVKFLEGRLEFMEKQEQERADEEAGEDL
jgi:predicted adenine nucleotide alpha hydrolase (AANH) superfamily ATPase